ncbi:MAG: 3-deoxy-manno-octulosonate cytidylyltransferase [Cyclobacteriaceae bacterium]
MRILGIIPSRYASLRFPGKPLIDIAGKSMIRRVYEQASKATCLSDLVVATDDTRIFDEIKKHGGIAMMTSPNHQNGTERCAEVVELLNEKFNFVINIQGDEPFISPTQIDLLGKNLSQETKLATLIKKEAEKALFNNPNTIKVTVDKDGRALYFSRAPLPHFKNHNTIQKFNKHIGIYAYRVDILNRITKLPPSNLELAESLEQLRWLENGFEIDIFETMEDSHSIDTPDDLQRVMSLQN